MEKNKDKYIEAIGRRKTSTARVRVTEAGKNSFTVNGKTANEYFQTEDTRRIAHDAMAQAMTELMPGVKWSIEVKIVGGGHHSQAEALRHGLSRAFVEINAESRPKLKTLGFLKRDARAKERRKFGLKKARKAPQWSKR